MAIPAIQEMSLQPYFIHCGDKFTVIAARRTTITTTTSTSTIDSTTNDSVSSSNYKLKKLGWSIDRYIHHIQHTNTTNTNTANTNNTTNNYQSTLQKLHTTNTTTNTTTSTNDQDTIELSSQEWITLLLHCMISIPCLGYTQALSFTPTLPTNTTTKYYIE